MPAHASSRTGPSPAFNGHALRGGLLGAILGGVGAALAIGGPLLLIGVSVGQNLSGEGHGLDADVRGMVVFLSILGLIALTPLFALSGAVGGAIGGAMSRPAFVKVALAAVASGILTGLLAMIYLTTGEANQGMNEYAFTFGMGGLIGALGGAIGGAIGSAVGRKMAAHS
jgi:hypothetical protein